MLTCGKNKIGSLLQTTHKNCVDDEWKTYMWKEIITMFKIHFSIVSLRLWNKSSLTNKYILLKIERKSLINSIILKLRT